MRAHGNPARQTRFEGTHDLAQLLGQLIADRYRVDALLGTGGMGAVLRCRHVWLHQDFALKVLHPELCGHAEVTRRFEHEARSVSRLDHPNCVRVLDFGAWEVPGMPESRYLCMELLAGVELTRLLDQPLGPAFAVDVTRQLLDGLAHAHARGVVHRDVKPQNIVVVAGGAAANVVKLVDFGIAKILTGDGAGARMTQEGCICGTPSYMSPEQVTGGPVDGRADLYSVGVLLYRMLAGRLPFESDNVRAILQMHVLEEPAPLPDHVPAALRGFVARLLQKDRDARFEGAAAARAELDAIAAVEQTSATSIYSLATSVHTPRPRVGPEPLPLAEAIGDRAPAARRRVAIRTDGVFPAHGSSPATPRPRRTWRPLAATISSLSIGALVVFAVQGLPGPEAPAARATEPAPSDVAIAGGFADDARAPNPPSELERARRLAESSATRHRALAAYDLALGRDPGLLDDPRVFAEVAALVRDPHSRAAALDLVLEHFGTRGGSLLVELLNTRLMPLSYEDRQRALAVVAHDPSLLALVDRGHLDALDLRDASSTDAPCLVFASALGRIDRAGDPLGLAELETVRIPEAPPGADAGTVGLCERLPAMLAATRGRLARVPDGGR